MKRSLWLRLGIVLIALGALWHFGLSSQWRQRFPVGWGPEFNFIGIATVPDPATGQFPATDSTGIYQRYFEVVERRADTVIVQDYYVIHDSVTGDRTYEYIFRAEVDPMTGAHLDERYRGDYYVFPREIEQTTYRLRQSYLQGLPLTFEREEKVEGVHTYLFSYKGSAEYTESYAGTEEYPGIQVEAGQEIRCADDQLHIDLWVEPLTGEVLQIDESCYAGDYVFDSATDNALYPVLRWGAVTAGDDVEERSNIIRSQRMRYLWATRYLPLLLLGAGLACLASAYSSRVQKASLHA